MAELDPRLAIYPGTFDPLTYGHMSLIKRGLKIFDTVVLAVAKSTPKKTCFSLEERVAMAEEAFAGEPRILVEPFDGLLVDYVVNRGAGAILRGLRAVSDFSLTLEKGVLFGLIGPNGAGKTTVFNLLTGVYKPDVGTVRLDGRLLNGLAPNQITGAGLSRTFQNIRLFPDLSVLDNVRVAGHLRLSHSLLAGLLRTARHRGEEAAVKVVGLVQGEGRGVDIHPGGQVQGAAQVGHGPADFGLAKAFGGGESHRPLLGQGPDIGAGLAHEEGYQHLAGMQLSLGLGQGDRPGIDQFGVFREAVGDGLAQPLALLPQAG